MTFIIIAAGMILAFPLFAILAAFVYAIGSGTRELIGQARIPKIQKTAEQKSRIKEDRIQGMWHFITLFGMIDAVLISITACLYFHI